MSRTFSRYNGKNVSKDYAGTVARRKNRAVRQVLRSTRITDVRNVDGDKFLEFEREDRSAVFAAASAADFED